jgi:hypothetical protein
VALKIEEKRGNQLLWNIGGLKLIYSKYPNLSTELYSVDGAKKEVINVSAQLIYEEEIIQNLNPQNNELVLNNTEQIIDETQVIQSLEKTL